VPGGLGQRAALVLVVQVVFQEGFQVVVGVADALAAVREVGGQLAVAGLLEEQGARGGRLEGAAVALAWMLRLNTTRARRSSAR
jgi:hypothetical protein